ncbi:isoprenoid synthase domain-containing protein [Suillus bovinus]|uniref:isoprenoid synthase domain-containing protein n=1 Tax=Suillus bovinus TaxID=48563 RepID=UPI001B876162|nr:isoprenoid synthase domain-containing protein [Suillus bovinus]KAG2151560.1 isoprenoid synthase domain-containing protein [Suillus bovinus]
MIMDPRPRVICLPNTMTNWPWPHVMNPHYEDVKAEVDAPFRKFKALSAKSQEAFDRYDSARLAGLAYPNASREHLRIACEFINVLIIVDEYTDVENAAVAEAMVGIVIDALHNPHKTRPEGECILGEIIRQQVSSNCLITHSDAQEILHRFWTSAIQTASLPFQRHFLASFIAYLRAVVVEALDRDEAHCRTISDYIKLRRDTCATKPAIAIYEVEMDLPDEVFNHPVIVELVEFIAELMSIDNDMISYNKEQATGDDNHNLITIVMAELGLDRSGAMVWAARYHAEVEKRFIDGLAKVPSWGPSTDVLVKQYLDGMATWARANHSWSYETQRYLGTRGPEILRTGLVPLLPKVNCKATSAAEKVNITDLSVTDAIADRKQPSRISRPT